MKPPTYLGLDEARQVLAEMGIELNERQMKRAAELNAKGKRKLPFFVCPLQKTLKIEKGSLVAAYRQAQIEAENGMRE